MPPDTPIRVNAESVDLTGRLFFSTAIVASPALAAETIIAQVAIALAPPVMSGVLLNASASYTIGTSGSACRLRLRQTNVAGALIADTGAMTGGHNSAGLLVSDDINGLDASPALPGQVYVLTLQVTAGAAASTVSGVYLLAVVI